MNIRSYMSQLSTQHQNALSWFEENSGQDDVPFTSKYNEIQLVSPAQGIYKPAWSSYALSVKETLNGSYPDQAPILNLE